MYRIVLDTNVFVSAYGFGGIPLLVLQRGVTGEYRLLSSTALMTELANTLYRVLDWSDEHVVPALSQIARTAELVEPTVRLNVIPDEADNRVLECGVAGKADLIVTGDNHLLRLESYEGIRIMRPAELLPLLGDARS